VRPRPLPGIADIPTTGKPSSSGDKGAANGLVR
jgi:hypothetical protein